MDSERKDFVIFVQNIQMLMINKNTAKLWCSDKSE